MSKKKKNKEIAHSVKSQLKTFNVMGDFWFTYTRVTCTVTQLYILNISHFYSGFMGQTLHALK